MLTTIYARSSQEVVCSMEMSISISFRQQLIAGLQFAYSN